MGVEQRSSDIILREKFNKSMKMSYIFGREKNLFQMELITNKRKDFLVLCKCLTRFTEVWALYELSLPTSHWLCETVVSINPNIDPESDKWTGSDVAADKGWSYHSLTNQTTPSAHKPFAVAPENDRVGSKEEGFKRWKR